MKHLRTFLLLLLLATTTGCGTIIKLHNEDAKDRRFAATRTDCYLLWEYWTDPTGDGDWVDLGAFKIMTPVTLIDLPFAIVLDTIQLPFDVHHRNTVVRADSFWKDAFSTGELPAGDPSEYFTRHTRDQIKWKLKSSNNDIEPSIIDSIMSLSVSNNSCQIIAALSALPYLSEEHSITLYDWQRARPKGHYSREVRNNLTKNPSTPLKLLTSLSAHEDNHTRTLAIETKRLPMAMVTNMLEELSRTEQWYCKKYVASHSATPTTLLAHLSSNDMWAVQEAVAKNTNSTIQILVNLSSSKHRQARAAVGSNLATPLNTLIVLSKDKEGCVRAAVAAHPATPQSKLIQMQSDGYFDVRRNLANNPNTPDSVLHKLSTDYYSIIKFAARKALRERNKKQNKSIQATPEGAPD